MNAEFNARTQGRKDARAQSGKSGNQNFGQKVTKKTKRKKSCQKCTTLGDSTAKGQRAQLKILNRRKRREQRKIETGFTG
jgi:hypothetical protein